MRLDWSWQIQGLEASIETRMQAYNSLMTRASENVAEANKAKKMIKMHRRQLKILKRLQAEENNKK